MSRPPAESDTNGLPNLGAQVELLARYRNGYMTVLEQRRNITASQVAQLQREVDLLAEAERNLMHLDLVMRGAFRNTGGLAALKARKERH